MQSRRIILIIAIAMGLLGLIRPLLGAGAFSHSQSGTAGAQFLTQGPGARPAGMGNAFCAVADDPSALFWNPAGLARVVDPQILLAHGVGLENSFHDYICYAQSLPGLSFGSAMQYASMAPMERWGEWGQPQGAFQPFDLSLAAAVALNVGNLSAGAGIKGFWQDLDGRSAQGFAVDLGGRFVFSGHNLAAGVKLENIGPPVKFLVQADPLPFAVRIGLDFRPLADWIFAMDLLAPAADSPSLHLGGEYSWQATPDFTIRPRAGLRTVNAPHLGFGPGLSCGLGLVYQGMSVDYAWLPFGALGGIHRISLSAALGNGREKPAPAIPKATPAPAPQPKKSPQPSRPLGPEPLHDSKPELELLPVAPAPEPAPTPAPALQTATEKPKPAATVAPQREQDYWLSFYMGKARNYLAQKKYFTAKTYCDLADRWNPNHPPLVELKQEIARHLKSPGSEP